MLLNIDINMRLFVKGYLYPISINNGRGYEFNFGVIFIIFLNLFHGKYL